MSSFLAFIAAVEEKTKDAVLTAMEENNEEGFLAALGEINKEVFLAFLAAVEVNKKVADPAAVEENKAEPEIIPPKEAIKGICDEEKESQAELESVSDTNIETAEMTDDELNQLISMLSEEDLIDNKVMLAAIEENTAKPKIIPPEEAIKGTCDEEKESQAEYESVSDTNNESAEMTDDELNQLLSKLSEKELIDNRVMLAAFEENKAEPEIITPDEAIKEISDGEKESMATEDDHNDKTAVDKEEEVIEEEAVPAALEENKKEAFLAFFASVEENKMEAFMTALEENNEEAFVTAMEEIMKDAFLAFLAAENRIVLAAIEESKAELKILTSEKELEEKSEGEKESMPNEDEAVKETKDE